MDGRADTKWCIANPGTQVVWRAAPVARAELGLGARWSLALDCGAHIFLVDQADGRADGWKAPVVPFCAIGAGSYLP